ncbi:MAG: amidase [Deltaproteobacteria bacterium]|nr:amidase [Deltaproteobacteria bacterium]
MGYRPKRVKAPRVAGGSLRLAARLAEGRLTGGLLAGTLLRSAGVFELRAAPVEEPHPVHPPGMPPAVAGGGEEGAAAPDPEGVLERLAASCGPGFRFETAAELAAAYRDGRTTPEEVAERVLDASRRLDEAAPPLRVFLAQSADDVRAQAREATARWRAGRPLSRLDGVPVAVKDEVDQRGYPTTVGTRFLGGEPATRDAAAVERLRSAGALLVGKANMHEIGLGVTGLNPHHGSARNPYDPSRATGGSSSGPAAAVAAGLCPLALGADGGGSIRIPASFCGVVGLKPTFGRVSERGAAPLCWSVAHLGPLGATVADAALGFAVLAGPDPEDRNSLGHPAPSLEGAANEGLAGLRLAVVPGWFEHADEAVVEACRAALERLRAAGATVVERELCGLELVRPVHLVTIVSEMAAAHLEHYRKHRKDYAADTRLNLALARRLTAYDYIHAQRHRARLCGAVAALFEEVDVLVTPATGCTAPPLRTDALRSGESDLETTERIMRFAPLANLTGLPAISVPAGYDANGLPIGLQLVGRAWCERVLLRVARAVEAGVERRAPRVHERLLGAAGGPG